MKKIFFVILVITTSTLFSVNNRESGNIYYEETFSSYGVEEFETDLSVEDLYIYFHNDDSILVDISGYAPGDDIMEFLDFGVDKSSFYIESLPQNFFGFTNYSIKIEVTLPSSYISYYNIQSSTGELYIDTPIEVRDFKAQSSTGDIFLESIKGDSVAIETSTGEKEIGEIITGDLYLKSSTGDNRLGNIRAGKGRIKASTGKSYISSYIGELEYSASTGDVEIENFDSGELSIDTSTGEVMVRLSQNSGWDIDLSTSTGDIDSSLPVMVVGKIDDDSLEGSVNGGGNRVRIKTSTGDIILR